MKPFPKQGKATKLPTNLQKKNNNNNNNNKKKQTENQKQ